MNSQPVSKMFRYILLSCALISAFQLMLGCNGDTGPAGPAGSAGGTVVNATTLTTDQWASTQFTGTVTSVTMASQPMVRFKVTDANGKPVAGLTATSQNATATLPGLTQLGFTIAKLVPGTNGSPSRWVSYIVTTVPTFKSASDHTIVPVAGSKPNTDTQGTLVDNGDGTYQYTFFRDITQAKAIVAGLTDSGNNRKADLGDLTFDPNLVHRLGIQIGGYARGTGSNTADGVTLVPEIHIGSPANVIYDFIPATGQVVAPSRDIVLMSSCQECHVKFTTVHGGNRQDPRYCVLCHTDQRKYGTAEATTTPTGYSGSTSMINGQAVGNFIPFIHRLHMSERLIKTGYNYAGILFNDITYPQDIINCRKCHKGDTPAQLAVTPQGNNWKTNPSRVACGACHDGIDFATGTGTTLNGATTGHANSNFAQADDSLCATCHDAAAIETFHRSTFATPNNPSAPPAGIASFVYEISSATVATTNTAALTSNVATVVFRIKKDGTPVIFNTFAPGGTVLLNGFTNVGPNFVVSYGAPQDGITAPSDWNSGHTSISIQSIWDGTNGTLSGPDANGFYTAVLGGGTLNNVAQNVPVGATMVTVGLKDPFVQTGLAGYPNGLSRPGIADFKAAAGQTARRVIIDAARCNKCHEQLGSGPIDLTLTPAQVSAPGFHTGNYNVANCAMCHTPNQSSGGWSASFRVWVHGIHGASKRSVPFTWHAVSATDTFAGVTYPGILSNCEQCHLPGTYDFSAPQYTQGLINNMLYVLTARGFYDPAGATAFRNSPYVLQDTTANRYGTNNYTVAFAAGTGAVTITDADPGTLVSSPITATCSACHDTSAAIAHMRSNGGVFYATRASLPRDANGKLSITESCLVCHGKGTIEDIKVVHGIK